MSRTNTAPAPTALEVGQAYLTVHKRLHRHVDDVMTAAGLSLSRAKVLSALHACGPAHQAIVAARLGIAPRSVTDIVDHQERAGLVERSPDPSDRRAWLVGVTPAGVEAHHRAETARNVAFDDIFGVLDVHSRAKLVELLRTIEQALPTTSGDCVD